MRRAFILTAALMALPGCTHLPWDYVAQQSQIEACYAGGTPDDVTACLARAGIKDPAYAAAFKPEPGAFCTPDLDAEDCRTFLETANESTIPPS